MKINGERLWQHLMALAEITDSEEPYTRRSFSARFLEGREWLTQQFQAAGLVTRIDSAGNLIGRLRGNGEKTGVITIGSHSDTVPNGGRFDGIAGVMAALECVLSWRENGVIFNHDIEVIDYLAEEPSEWGISCVGSRGISGALSAEQLSIAHPQTGELLSEAIVRMGGNPAALKVREDIAAAFELHIEQGRVLENARIDVGVVTGIVGIIRLEVVLEGQANHAGTTPMPIRQDANTAAAELIIAAEQLANDYTKKGKGYFVATCGQIFPMPNASNVIAGQCRLVFDIRSDTRKWMDDFVNELHKKAGEINQQRKIAIERWAILTDTHPVLSNQALIKHVQQAAEQLNISAQLMPSGAGHDAAFLARLAPMVMIFVPSKEGISHNPKEWTTLDELARGTAVLAQSIEFFDKNNL